MIQENFVLKSICKIALCYTFVLRYLYDIVPKVFDGVSDRNTPVTRMFPRPVFAESIRINPKEWKEWIAVRFEVLGCDGE